MLSENQKEASRTPYLEGTAEATGVSRATVARIIREKSKTGRVSSPTRAKREPYKYYDSFDKAAIRHKVTKLYTVWKQFPILNTLNSTRIWDMSFPGSVVTQRKRLSQLGFCWKKACNGRKVLVWRQKYCTTAKPVLCMLEKISRTGDLISFKLMRPGWIPASPLRNAGKGKRHLT